MVFIHKKTSFVIVIHKPVRLILLLCPVGFFKIHSTCLACHLRPRHFLLFRWVIIAQTLANPNVFSL